jgi:hypothetical protein
MVDQRCLSGSRGHGAGPQEIYFQSAYSWPRGSSGEGVWTSPQGHGTRRTSIHAGSPACRGPARRTGIALAHPPAVSAPSTCQSTGEPKSAPNAPACNKAEPVLRHGAYRRPLGVVRWPAHRRAVSVIFLPRPFICSFDPNHTIDPSNSRRPCLVPGWPAPV